jgi:hypothetical protein
MKLSQFAGYAALGAVVILIGRSIVNGVVDSLNHDKYILVQQLLQRAYPDYSLYADDVSKFLTLFKIKYKRPFDTEKDSSMELNTVISIFVPNPSQKRQHQK